jgi:signal transduction histidine kinase
MQLQQVFTNLALNAYQAMLSEGRPGTLTVRTKTSNDAVQIEFQDTGPGIPQEHVARLFEPFFTTKAEGEGTGLGLSITYGIVQSHGGTLQVRSDPGQGACFIISLPVKKDLPNDGGEVQESP